MLKNYMEQIVDDIFPTVIDKYTDICKCEKCINDIKAITLNNLKPLYIVTEEGAIYSRMKELEQQFKTDVMSEIIKAIEIVSKKPKHNF